MVREIGSYRDEFFTGAATQPVIEAVESLIRNEAVRRLWAIDAGLFTSDPDSAKTIPQRMGWLRSPEFMGGYGAALRSYSREVYAQGIRKVLVVGVGGTVAAPQALARCYGKVAGYPELRVLDSVEPGSVHAALDFIDPKTTSVVVMAKEGDAVELVSLEAACWQKMTSSLKDEEAAARFVAVTDPGSELQRLARRRHYGRVFENPPDMSERYTAISFYGLVPAALLGVDVESLLEDAKKMGEACSPAVAIEDNPGFRLGSFIVGLARVGRDKVTLILSPKLQPFGAWVEHMLADSTARKNRGMYAITGEPMGSPQSYGPDRSFVYIHLDDEKRGDADELVDSLVASGQPVGRIVLGDLTELGGELFRWEVATALVAHHLRINPFDDPGHAASRNATERFLKAHQRDSMLPRWRSAAPTGKELVEFVKGLKARDYLGMVAYFPPSPARDRLFNEMRRLLRSKRNLATAAGYGTPFLYATGQLHKNGPASAALVMLTATVPEDVSVPGQQYSFGVLRDAQALGDLQLMQHNRRRVLRVHLGTDIDAGLEALRDSMNSL
jgi:glucose-6-phosphate isomerase